MKTNSISRILCFLSVFISMISSPFYANDMYEGNVVTQEGAWCWFADPRALHHESKDGTINNTYIGYIDVHGNIKATQHNFITGITSEVLIRSYFQPDDHNNPSFLILPDERVMIFYSRHTDEACFYYRISKKPGDITALGEEYKILTKFNTTYPSPFILSDDPEHFYLCWRGIKWHPTIARLTLPNKKDEVKINWGPYQMLQSTAARPYCKYSSNGKDKILITYTTGHPDNEYPNYVFYNYIDINSLQLKDVKGNVLSKIEEGVLQVNQSTYPDTFSYVTVDKPTTYRDWIWQATQGKDGNPVIAMVQISEDKTSHDYYYAKWTGTEWRKTYLANGGGHFHQSPKIEKCYSAGMALDDSNPDQVICSVPVKGNSGMVYELMKFTIDDNGKVSSKEQITKNSTLNNSRPYIVTNSGNGPLKIIWMHGKYYDWIVSNSRPLGFSTAIHSDYALGTAKVDLNNGLIVNEKFEGKVKGSAKTENGVLSTSKENHAMIKVKSSNAFSVSISPFINPESYNGDIVSFGNIKYGLDEATLKPFIAVDGERHNSTNVLGTSDVWQTQRRGTGGQWYEPTKLGYFNLSFTYSGNILTVYINGLIDQVIEIDNIELDNIRLGGFEGEIEDCRIYNRVLLQEEVKALSKISLKK